MSDPTLKELLNAADPNRLPNLLALIALGHAPFDALWGSFAVVAMGVLAATAWRSPPAAAAAAPGRDAS